MPPLDEGTLLYMPTTLPGHLDRRGADAAAGAGPHHQAVPRSRARARQGGPRRDVDRSGAALDDGDRRSCSSRRREWRTSRDAGTRLGAGVAEAACFRRVTPDHISHGAAGRRDERGAAAARASRTPGRCRSRTRIDMLTTGIRTPVGHQDLRRRSRTRSSGSARRSRRCCRAVPRHAQRVRRAHRRRLLPRLRLEPRRSSRATA